MLSMGLQQAGKSRSGQTSVKGNFITSRDTGFVAWFFSSGVDDVGFLPSKVVLVVMLFATPYFFGMGGLP